MLQKYTFIAGERVNELQLDIVRFIRNIQGATGRDTFNPDVHIPEDLYDKVVKMVKGKDGKLTHNLLYKKFVAFFDAFKILGVQKRRVVTVFRDMNQIESLFDTTSRRWTIEDLPEDIQKPTRDLFVYLYENTLDSYKVKKHYEIFSKSLGNNWCPFCGMEQLTHYTHQKEDYDHLLAKSIYPFAAVNMRNLVPMGQKCNRTHKKAKDLIWTEDGIRVRAINPYKKSLAVKVNFDGTVLPKANSRNGNWNVTLTPARAEVSQWNFVFNVGDRIVKDYLNNGKKSEYQVWLTDYLNENDNKNSLNSKRRVRDSLIAHGRRFENEKYRSARYIQSDLFKWMGSNAPDEFIDSIMAIINRKKLRP